MSDPWCAASGIVNKLKAVAIADENGDASADVEVGPLTEAFFPPSPPQNLEQPCDCDNTTKLSSNVDSPLVIANGHQEFLVDVEDELFKSSEELCNLESKNERLADENADIKLKLAALEKEVTKSTASAQEMRRLLQAKHNEIAQMEAKLRNEKAIKAKLEDMLATERNHYLHVKLVSVANLQTRLANKASELVKERSKMREMQKTIDSLLQNVSAKSELQNEVAQLKQELAATKRKLQMANRAEKLFGLSSQREALVNRELLHKLEARRSGKPSSSFSKSFSESTDDGVFEEGPPYDANNSYLPESNQGNGKVEDRQPDVIFDRHKELLEAIRQRDETISAQNESLRQMNEKMNKTIEIFPINFEKLEKHIEESLETLNPPWQFHDERCLLECLRQAVSDYRRKMSESDYHSTSLSSTDDEDDDVKILSSNNNSSSTMKDHPPAALPQHLPKRNQFSTAIAITSSNMSSIAESWWPWKPCDFKQQL